MDKLLLKKFKTAVVVMALLGAGSAALAVISAGLVFSGRGVQSAAAVQEEELLRALRSSGPDPQENIEMLKKIKSGYERRDAVLAGMFGPVFYSAPDAPAPLFFRQRLFEVQEQLRQKAAQAGTRLPADLGFGEFEINLPPPENTALLMKELLMMEEIVTIILENGAPQVSGLKFAHEYKTVSFFAPAEVKREFKALKMELELEAEFSAVKKILRGVLNRRDNYGLKLLEINKSKEQARLLRVNAELEYLESGE